MSKRYYWIKLKEDFFSSKRIKKLRKIASGDTYTIIYLKMLLLAMKNDGYIKYTGLEKNIAEEFSLDLDEDIENVKATLQYLLQTGLCETSDNINFFMPYAVENVGSECSSAERVRECRERKVLQCNKNVTERRDRERDREDIYNISPDKPAKKQYGKHKNVSLTDEELKKIKDKFPNSWEQKIENLSAGIELKGYRYKNHYLAVLKWAENDKDKTTECATYNLDDVEQLINQ